MEMLIGKRSMSLLLIRLFGCMLFQVTQGLAAIEPFYPIQDVMSGQPIRLRYIFCGAYDVCSHRNAKVYTPSEDCDITIPGGRCHLKGYAFSDDPIAEVRNHPDASDATCKICAVIISPIMMADAGTFSICKLTIGQCYNNHSIVLNVEKPNEMPPSTTRGPAKPTQTTMKVVTSAAIVKTEESHDNSTRSNDQFRDPSGSAEITTPVVIGVVITLIVAVLIIVGIRFYKRNRRNAHDGDDYKRAQSIET